MLSSEPVVERAFDTASVPSGEGGGLMEAKRVTEHFREHFFAGVVFRLPIDLLLKFLSLDFTALII